MATLNVAQFLLVLFLAIQATATPCEQSVNIFANGRRILVHNLSGCSTSVIMVGSEKISVPPLSRAVRYLSHVKRRSTMAVDETARSDSVDALKETGKLIRMVAMLPPETLQVVRMIAVPLLNKTLALPANVLEQAVNMSVEKARSSGNSLWQHIANLNPKHKQFVFHKNLTLGPLSLKKIIAFGTPMGAADVLPKTTPAPATIAESTPPPMAVVVPETPAPPVAVLSVTTPAPVVIAETTPPPVAVVVPETPAPPVALPPTTTPAPVVVAGTLPPVAAVVVGTPSSLVAAKPCAANGGSTTQVAVVQQSSPAEIIPEDSH